MAVPLYVFLGFLEAGKTSFIQETLEDPDFNTGEKTLLVLCEDGEVEYEPQKFAGGNVAVLPVEGQQALTRQLLEDYTQKHRVDRVLVEYNGMWPVQVLYDALPKGWEIFQMMTVADSTTFPSYLANMRQLAVEKMQEPDVVIFNRVTQATDKATLHRAVRMVNRRAQILFETVDGEVEPDTIVDELPFDMDADVVDIGDEDYGLFYIDIFDNVKKYLGKTIRFKAYVCQTKRVPEGCFVAGRFGMTCCAEDITFIGLICEAEQAKQLKHRTWVTVTAKVTVKKHAIYQGPGPWLVAESVTPAQPPEDELVYFI